jgi:arginine decarboxylase-like protein
VRIETNDGNGGTFQKVFPITINNLSEVLSTIIDFETSGKYTLTS